MDKLQFAQIAPMVFVLVIVIAYYLIARRKPKSKEAELYQSLIHDGCQHCDVDHSLQHAWRIK